MLKNAAEVATSTNPIPLAINCGKLAVLLYDVYSTRGDKLHQFASYMQNVGIAVTGMADRLTGNAVPILQQLQSALERATGKLEKYKRRNKVEIAYYAHSEASHIRKLTDQVSSLVPLLQLTLSGQNNMAAMHAELRAQQEALQAQAAPPEVIQHMQTLDGAATAIATAESPADVHVAAQHVADSQMALTDKSMDYLGDVHRSMQHTLSEGFGELTGQLHSVQSSQVALASSLATLQAELKQEMSGLRQEISRQTGIVGDKLQGIEDGLVHVLEELQKSTPQRDCSTAALGCKTAAELLMEALRSGRIKCTGCPVEGLPYAAAGPLRPVKLAHCGCTLSAHAADKCIAAERCLLCRRVIPKEKSGYRDDKQIVRVAEAESIGIRVPQLDPARITRGERIGKGGEGVVHRATLDGVGEVAIKCLPLGGTSEQDHAQVSTMLTSTYLASTATPLVCRLHGVAWQADEVWVVMELCEGTAMAAVARARKADQTLEGLPPADVVVLAMEVSEALSALHERARTLHLDLKPENVLMTSELKVRLSDFGISRRLPTRITAKTMTGISAGTPGYASPEQMLHRRGTARSDVYSLGASIIFFATGMHPFESCGDMSFIAAQLATGQAMPVPDGLAPERLRSLVQRMVRIDEAQRPSLHQVRKELHHIHRKLTAQGARPRFVQPYWGAMATTEPPPPVHAAEEAPETQRAPPVTKGATPAAAPPPTAEPRHTAPQNGAAPPDLSDADAPAPFNTAPVQSPFSAEAAYATPDAQPSAGAPPPMPGSAAPPPPAGAAALAPPAVTPQPAAPAAPLAASPAMAAEAQQMPPSAFVSGPSGQAPPYASGPSGGAGHTPPYASGPSGGAGQGPPYAAGPSGGASGHPSLPTAGSGVGPVFSGGMSGGASVASAHSLPHAQSMPHHPGSHPMHAAQQPVQAGGQNGMAQNGVLHSHSMPHAQPQHANMAPPFQTAPAAAMPSYHHGGGLPSQQQMGLGGYHQPGPSLLKGLTLPQLFDTINQQFLGQQVDLEAGTYAMPLLTKVRSLFDKANNPITRLPDMDPQLLAQPVKVPSPQMQTLWALQVAAVGSRSLTLWGGGTTVARGTLAVPDKVFLILGPQCANVTFRDIYFKGGRLLCHGPTCSVRFENCRFSKSGVVAIGGAGVSFFNCLAKHTDLAFVANGPGTKLTMRKVEAVDCNQVLLVDGGAMADVDALQAKQHSITGVEARGAGSRLTLARSGIAEALAPDPAAPDRNPRLYLPHGWPVRALHVHSGAAANASECTFAASYTGAAAAGSGTTVSLAKSFIIDNVRSGAAAAGGAALTMKQCTCSATAAPQTVGAEAGDAGTTVALQACSLQGNASCGVMAYGGAAVTLKGCVSQRNGTAGCYAQGNALIAMSDKCRSEHETGHSVHGGGTVTATADCVFVPLPQPPPGYAQQPVAAAGHAQHAQQPQGAYGQHPHAAAAGHAHQAQQAPPGQAPMMQHPSQGWSGSQAGSGSHCSSGPQSSTGKYVPP